MSVPALSASNAYINAAKNISDAKGLTDMPKTNDSKGFAGLVEDAVKSFSDSGQKVEKMTANHLVGKADMIDVVTSVAETELTMRTLVTVRDRVISAYQDVIRMPI